MITSRRPPEGGGNSGRIVFRHVDAGFDRYVLAGLSSLHSILPGAPPRYFHHYRDAFYARRAAEACREAQTDCIAFAACPQWAARLRELNPDARLVFFQRDEWLCAAPRDFNRFLECLDAVICPYGALAERISSRFPGIASRLHVVPDGVDANIFRPHRIRTRHRLLYVGRISEERGVQCLLDAFDTLRERYPDADLVMVGKEVRSSRESLVGTPFMGRTLRRGGRGIAERIRRRDGIALTGHVRYRDLPLMYSTASVLIVPSLVDTPSGLTLVEAMASGVPVVATRVGAAPEILKDGRAGILVDPGEPGQIVAAVEKIFDNRDTAARMGEAGRNAAEEKFNWKDVTARCLQAAGITDPGPS